VFLVLMAVVVLGGVAGWLVPGRRRTAPIAVAPAVPRLLGAALVLQLALRLLPDGVRTDIGSLFVGASAVLAGAALVLVARPRSPLRPAAVLALVGGGLNAAVVPANGGMPVSGDAIERLALAPAALGDDDPTARHVVLDDGTCLAVLADVVPLHIGPERAVFSAGDVVLLAAAASSSFAVSRRRPPTPTATPDNTATLTPARRPRPQPQRSGHHRHSSVPGSLAVATDRCVGGGCGSYRPRMPGRPTFAPVARSAARCPLRWAVSADRCVGGRRLRMAVRPSDRRGWSGARVWCVRAGRRRAAVARWRFDGGVGRPPYLVPTGWVMDVDRWLGGRRGDRRPGMAVRPAIAVLAGRRVWCLRVDGGEAVDGDRWGRGMEVSVGGLAWHARAVSPPDLRPRLPRRRPCRHPGCTPDRRPTTP
jgi:hypothetical protein